MNVIGAPCQLQAGLRPICLAIGFFDGVHLGHQRILEQCLSQARRTGACSVAVTFDRHPNEIVARSRVPPLIYSLSTKLRVLELVGLEATCVLPFDKPFSQLTAEQFIANMAAGFKPLQSVSVGRAFTFGHRRLGNVALLKAMGKKLGFRVVDAREVILEGTPVSSTRVREWVRAGDFDGAARLLGRPYTLRAPVAPGTGLGRQLGFPTANLDTAGLLTPPEGVYAGRAEIGGRQHGAAINIGRRPTVCSSSAASVVEAHLLDFQGDLVGQQLELTFLKKLRREQKFPSVDALRGQIAADIALARQSLKT